MSDSHLTLIPEAHEVSGVGATFEPPIWPGTGQPISSGDLKALADMYGITLEEFFPLAQKGLVWLPPVPTRIARAVASEEHITYDQEEHLLDQALGRSSRYSAHRTAIGRARRPDFAKWMGHIGAAAGCTQPIRLSGQSHTVHVPTGQVLNTVSTSDMPDGVIYKACGNRRASVCPSCAKVYRDDTFHMLRAGLVGGYDIPESVKTHPAVFVTIAAPSFGPVHARVINRKVSAQDEVGRIQPCRPHFRTKPLCPHGKVLYCGAKHGENDPRVGQPFCLDCYDYEYHAVWNGFSGELWRRTTIELNRILARIAKPYGYNVKATFGKAAEYQKRGVVHFHAIIRVDGKVVGDPTAVIPPPSCITHNVLMKAAKEAVATTRFMTDSHTDKPEGWLMEWGHKSIDIKPINFRGDQAVNEIAVASYLAKYTAKATEDTGHISKRLTSDTIDIYADEETHTGRIIDACWRLGIEEGFERLRRWAHMLGFGGHAFTASRAYSATRRDIKHRRTLWQRRHKPSISMHDLENIHAEETILVINQLRYHGTGWLTIGDALLANSSAAQAREHKQVVKEELD